MSLSELDTFLEERAILGVVMCGGLSTRMGHDKGLLIHNGKFWAQIIAEKFSSVGLKYVFSINAEQEASYKMALGEDKKFVIDNTVFAGPLNGLMSVHKEFPKRSLLPLACDMLRFNPDIIPMIITVKAFNANNLYFAAPIESSQKYQPFGAVYSAKGLKSIRQKEAKNNLSMSKILATGKTYSLDGINEAHFYNFNSPKDLL